MSIKFSELSSVHKQKYIDLYLETHSVSAILREYGQKDGVGRTVVEKVLKEAGVYIGNEGSHLRANKIKETMQKKHGVDNPGQLKTNDLEYRNSVPYNNISLLDDELRRYKQAVNSRSRSLTKNMDKPKFCYYTGIQFADEEQGIVNPNDPRKRTIDHIVPIAHCYLNGVSVDDCASIDNIAFVLRYVNTLKGNTLHDSFLPLAPKIRRVFIDEGYPSN